jgi:hypothetical protein
VAIHRILGHARHASVSHHTHAATRKAIASLKALTREELACFGILVHAHPVTAAYRDTNRKDVEQFCSRFIAKDRAATPALSRTLDVSIAVK